MDVKPLTILQKRIKKKLLHKKSKELKSSFEELFLLVSCNYNEKNNVEEIEKDFDSFSKIIRDEFLIKKFQRFLNYLYDVYPENNKVAKKITSKIFLSKLLMYGFPEIVLDLSRKNMDNSIKTINYHLYHFSKLLITNFRELINKDFNEDQMRKFIKYLNIYSNVFYLFIHQDKIKQINKITNEHYQIKKTIKEIYLSCSYDEKSKIEIIDNLNNTLNGLNEMLLIISPKYDLENLEFYRHILDILDETQYDSFWEKFKENLSKEKNDETINKLVFEKINKIIETYNFFNIKKISDKILFLEKYIHKLVYL